MRFKDVYSIIVLPRSLELSDAFLGLYEIFSSLQAISSIFGRICYSRLGPFSPKDPD